MPSGTRPGSLTFFAVVNFVLAGLGGLGLLAQSAMLLVRQSGHGHGPGPFHGMPSWWIWVALIGGALQVALQIISGIGLLRQSVLWGRWAATVLGFLALALTIAGHLVGSHDGSGVGGSLRPVTLVMGALYPLALLVWVNVVLIDLWRPPRLAGGGDGTAHPFALTVRLALRQHLRSAAGPGFALGLTLAGLLVCFGLLLFSAFAAGLGTRTGFAPTPEQRLGLLETGTATVLGTVLREEESATAAPVDGMAVEAEKTEPLSRRWAKHLVREHPAGMSFAWLLLAMLLPTAVLFAATGQIARDVGNRGFRFILTRIDRDSIFLGRFAAAAIVTSAVVVLTVAACAVVMGLSEPQPAWGAIAAWAGWAALALIVASLPIVALGMLCSTVVGHPFAALSLAQAAVIGWPLVAYLGLGRVWDPLAHAVHLLPVVVQFWLFHPAWWANALAAVACLAYTAVYLWLGRWHFRTRDL